MEYPITVGILVFNQVELLDFAGPFEVFSVSGSKNSPTPGSFEVKLIAASEEPVTTQGGMRVLPDFSIDNHPEFEVLLVPGGPGTQKAMGDERVMEWLRNVQPRFAIASVSTGALLLAEAGRLDDFTATSRADSIDALAQYERVVVQPDRRFIDRGTILTSSGVSAGIDMALHLVERFVGRETALYTTSIMEYEHRASTPNV
jgi:transcriptional regulator GlxA family with amidase domain